jgi:hypothetical protein
MDNWIKVAVNAAALSAWILTITTTIVSVRKGVRLKEVAGISLKGYFFCLCATEVLYSVGILSVLLSMGVNVLRSLSLMDVVLAQRVLSGADAEAMRTFGFVGWFGFATVSIAAFLSPGYIIIHGLGKSDRSLSVLAWIEIGMELFALSMIAIALAFG